MCYILEKFGYQTAFVDTQGYDVIVNYKKRPIRIQVKSALSRDYNRKKFFIGYLLRGRREAKI